MRLIALAELAVEISKAGMCFFILFLVVGGLGWNFGGCDWDIWLLVREPGQQSKDNNTCSNPLAQTPSLKLPNSTPKNTKTPQAA